MAHWYVPLSAEDIEKHISWSPFAFTSSKITVKQTVTHDYNCDGVVSGRDYILLANYLSNFDFSTYSSTVKINEAASSRANTEINGIDLILLRQFLSNQ